MIRFWLRSGKMAPGGAFTDTILAELHLFTHLSGFIHLYIMVVMFHWTAASSLWCLSTLFLQHLRTMWANDCTDKANWAITVHNETGIHIVKCAALCSDGGTRKMFFLCWNEAEEFNIVPSHYKRASLVIGTRPRSETVPTSPLIGNSSAVLLSRKWNLYGAYCRRAFRSGVFGKVDSIRVWLLLPLEDMIRNNINLITISISLETLRSESQVVGLLGGRAVDQFAVQWWMQPGIFFS